VEGLLVALVFGVLIGALLFTSRRWGPPRLHTPVTVALWATVAIFALVWLLLWLG